MADMITPASTDGLAASSSAIHRPLGASWNGLLVYLEAAGFCEQQLRDVQSMLRDIPFQDIDITILRMDGEKHDLTISGYLTAAGLKKLLASEWTIQTSSLQLAIGSTCLRDSDVIAEFVSSADRVVNAVVVRAPRALQDRDQFTEVNDTISAKLEIVAPYMDAGSHQHLMTLWEQSCQRAQESCEAAACALARLSHDLVLIPTGDRSAKDIVRAARREIRDAMVQRVQGWQLVNTLDLDRMRCVFERLASDAGCADNTVSQLLNGARRLQEERHGQQAHRRVRGPAGPNILNVVGGPDRG